MADRGIATSRIANGDNAHDGRAIMPAATDGRQGRRPGLLSHPGPTGLL
jgi:hypothetical protein